MSAVDSLAAVVNQTLWVLYEGALLILVGFAVAGTIHVLLDPDRIVKYLGERSLRSAALAAVLGAPMPLCSCGVLPTAVSLRRKGASPEATLSFLVTTPETGVDSIAMTLAYLGPLVAVARPLAAVATALVAAWFSLRRTAPDVPPAAEEGATPPAVGPTALRVEIPGPAPLHDTGAFVARVGSMARHAARYAFVELLDELAFWLVLSIVLTGTLSAVLPADAFTRLFPSSFAAMLALAVLSIPLYVCASASTPLAAMFVTKGASGGAALVFLLVGPATNAATVATVGRLFGPSFLRVYLGSIIGMAIAAGLVFDVVAPAFAADMRFGQPMGSEPFAFVKAAAAVVLGMLLVQSLRRTGIRSGLRELAENARAAAAAARGLRLRSLASNHAIHALAALWAVSVIAGGLWRVPFGQRAIVRCVGRISGVARGPGLTFAIPFVDRVTIVPVDQVRAQPVGYRTVPGGLRRDPVLDEALYVTADENVIDLHAEAQYRIADAVRYALDTSAPPDVLSALVRARLVEAMAARSIDRVYTDERVELERRLVEHLRRDADDVGLGIDLLGVRLLDVHAPATVHDAFRDVASAHEDRLTTIHVANQYAVGVVAVARGEAAARIAAAEADAADRVARASGAAAAFTALAAEHRRAPKATDDRLYLEAAERVLPGARKLIRASDGALHGYSFWLDGTSAPPVLASPSGATDGTRPHITPPHPPASPPPGGLEQEESPP